MANIKELRQNGKTYPLADEQARKNIGDLSKLKTAAKDSLVDAVNELNGGASAPYRSVQSKLADLTNPFKPTAVAMTGDSITAGYHSANAPYITNCYANLFGAYLLEHFNDKVYNIPFFDEHVEVNNSGAYTGLETGCVIPANGYAKIRFYGSYLAVNTYNGQLPNVVMTVYIDNNETPYATYNFGGTSAKWETESLSMDYHTAKIVFSAKCTMGSFGIKKYVTFANRAVSGKNSNAVREYFRTDRMFDNDDILFCMIGTNDRSDGNPALYDYNVRQVLKHGMESMGNQVILMSATPSPREAEVEYTYHMADVVAWVNLIGGKENEQVISFYNWLLDYAKEHNAELGSFFNDGLHPTEACHALMFEHLLRECGFGINM